MSKDKDRYSRVKRRMWIDADFQALSAPAPNAQTLWKWMLTCPEQTNLPGLMRTGVAGIAEALHWPIDATAATLDEILELGWVKVDAHARFVWVVNAIHHNAPNNPNVVRGWAQNWDELPECPLKDEAHAHLHAWMAERGAAWVAAFEDACGAARKGFGKGSAKGSAKGSGNGFEGVDEEVTPTLPEASAEAPPKAPDSGPGEPRNDTPKPSGRAPSSPRKPSDSSGQKGSAKGIGKGSGNGSPNQEARSKKQEARDQRERGARDPLASPEDLLAHLEIRPGLDHLATLDEAQALHGALVGAGVHPKRVVEILDVVAPETHLKRSRGEAIAPVATASWIVRLGSRQKRPSQPKAPRRDERQAKASPPVDVASEVTRPNAEARAKPSPLDAILAMGSNAAAASYAELRSSVAAAKSVGAA